VYWKTGRAKLEIGLAKGKKASMTSATAKKIGLAARPRPDHEGDAP